MAKEKRRSWLGKISSWILGALPEDKASALSTTQASRVTPSPSIPQQPTTPKLRAEPTRPSRSTEQEIEETPAQQTGRAQTEPPGTGQTATAGAPSTAAQQADPPGNTINRAWSAFKRAWADAGLSDHHFLEGEELEQTLAVLDRTFQDELIEWLFQLCTKPEALRDLAGIIERGHVRPKDNIAAIRAFAYVSVAIRTRPARSASPTEPISAAGACSHPAPYQTAEGSSFANPETHNGPSVSSPQEESTTADSAAEPRAITSNLPIEELGLSIRSYNCLKRADIHTILDLASRSEESLLKIKNFGQKSADEVRRALARRGLPLPFQSDDLLALGSPENSKDIPTSQQADENPDDIISLGLATRTINELYRAHIYLISQLLQYSENDLLQISNLGPSAVQDIKSRLESRGLLLLDECFQWQAETKLIWEQQQKVQALEEAWQKLRQLAEHETGLPSAGFDALTGFSSCYPNDPASQHLTDILDRLQASLSLISDTLSQQYPDQQRAIQCSAQALQDGIASQLLHRSADSASQWVHQITKSFSPIQERNWLVYLLRCSGPTLAAIGDAINPPVSRERARQMEAKVANVIGIKSTELAELTAERQDAARLANEREAIKGWLDDLGRIPIPSDPKQPDSANSELWDEICRMDLKGRSALLTKHTLAIPPKESDYHYQYVVEQYGPVGTGYWRKFENLRQFILRHAVALGAPELMPKQTSFPRAVGGIVQSYGGQGKVAKRIGLQYQGQLVGSDGGRRYWTDERLLQLLTDTNSHHQLEADVMPSYGDILEFFTATNLAEYQDKKPHSAIAALTKMGTLHWSEVALRFNKRFISGESQKSVTLSYIKAFVRDLGDHLVSLSPSELFVLFQAQGINRGEKEKFSRTFDALVDAIQSGVVDKGDLRCWAENNQVASIDDLLELGAELKAEPTIEDKEQKLLERRSKKLMEEFPQQEGQSEIQATDLPTLEPVKILRALDKAADIVDNSASDRDKVDFLKSKAAAKLWDACFQDEGTLISKLRAYPAVADSYSQEVQQAFIEEYEGARALPIPDNYTFCDLKGTARDPKLMQRLVAFRLKRDFRLLNLSGTGTGKTLSAIYAAQICGCRRLLISCPNGVIESWRRAFTSAFPSANLIIKPDGWEFDDISDGVNVVIVNHERFQDRFTQQLLGFCVNYQADMIVIDEIHQSKRRSSDKSSQRRKLMNEFIRISSNINTELRVLGLSATPVINNLYEGRSLLELIRQESIDDVHETVDLNSCMNLYQHFVVHGIRMNPGQLSRTKLIHQEIDATSLLPQIVWATKHGTYHDIEQLLVAPKINSLRHSLERGVKTVIFVTYIKNTLRPIANWLSSNNYSFSVFTGDEKEAQEDGFRDSLDEFIRGNTEVLVASVQCAGTGVDGLQSVCNRAIFFQLPWTSTEFEQTIGRLDRDGTEFESVNVYLPMTEISLPNGERWSWCRSKLDRIESKRDIAKAAVDGEIPDAATLISPSEASKYWLNWLGKLEQQSQITSTMSD